MLCITSLQTGPAVKSKCDALAPLVLNSLSIAPPATQPQNVPASAYLPLLEDLANIQIRLVGMVVTLSPPKGNMMSTSDTQFIDHLVRLLHEAPVSAANAKDLLIWTRHIIAKFRKLPPTDPAVAALHVRTCCLHFAILYGSMEAMLQRTLQVVLAQQLCFLST